MSTIEESKVYVHANCKDRLDLICSVLLDECFASCSGYPGSTMQELEARGMSERGF